MGKNINVAFIQKLVKAIPGTISVIDTKQKVWKSNDIEKISNDLSKLSQHIITCATLPNQLLDDCKNVSTDLWNPLATAVIKCVAKQPEIRAEDLKEILKKTSYILQSPSNSSTQPIAAIKSDING